MDWTPLAMQLSFLTNNGDIAAERLAQFLIFLSNNGTPLESIHIIGHSWGAHVAGIAGRKLRGRIGRITGGLLESFAIHFFLFLRLISTYITFQHQGYLTKVIITISSAILKGLILLDRST